MNIGALFNRYYKHNWKVYRADNTFRKTLSYFEYIVHLMGGGCVSSFNFTLLMSSQARKPLRLSAKTHMKFHLMHLKQSLCKLCLSLRRSWHMHQNVSSPQGRLVQCYVEHCRGDANKFYSCNATPQTQ